MRRKVQRCGRLALVAPVLLGATLGQTKPPFAVTDEIAVRDSISRCSVVAMMSREDTTLSYEYGTAPVTGAPYSAVARVAHSTTFADGNQLLREETLKYYRDSRGRTRIERTVKPYIRGFSSTDVAPAILINDPVRGECSALQVFTKVAYVVPTTAEHIIVKPPVTPTPIPSAHPTWPAFDFSGAMGFDFSASLGSGDRKNDIDLGEKTLEGFKVTGIRVEHTIRPGELGNTRPVSITVERWFSPDMGLVIASSQKSSIGGESSFKLEQIVRGEPDAALFRVPPDYTKQTIQQRFSEHLSAEPRKTLPAQPTRSR